MKRVTKLLSLIIVLAISISAFSACGSPNKAPANAVKAVAESFFIDFDTDGLFDAHAKYALDLVKYADDSKADNLKDEIKEARAEMKDTIKDVKEKSEGKKAKLGDSMTSITITQSDSQFNDFLKLFIYYGTGIEDNVDEIAIVTYSLTVDGETAESKMITYKIGNKWYVGA